MSSAEAEYMALSASCAQEMWMRTQLQDYGLNYNNIPLYRDSQSAIVISCNPVQHSCTKHIYTRYHFIKEQVENSIIELYFVRTKYQLADTFTKALPEDRFKYLVRRIDNTMFPISSCKPPQTRRGENLTMGISQILKELIVMMVTSWMLMINMSFKTIIFVLWRAIGKYAMPWGLHLWLRLELMLLKYEMESISETYVVPYEYYKGQPCKYL
uniref:Retrovirus-related Pol polyprotein from transposon TNT 1-94 n=1 Tax=Tanacetum cinerariifolium TaxID=118510 RepID=A0A6L2NG58_TANCI|nr:retrovirus-related Pol polyprotein from transposon TNT 1-94 [Tanacetum cinerariifolium]